MTTADVNVVKIGVRIPIPTAINATMTEITVAKKKNALVINAIISNV